MADRGYSRRFAVEHLPVSIPADRQFPDLIGTGWQRTISGSGTSSVAATQADLEPPRANQSMDRSGLRALRWAIDSIVLPTNLAARSFVRTVVLVLVLSATVLVLERSVMAEPIFDHERLDVYRLSIEYIAFSYRIAKTLGGVNRHARDQWLRAAQSVALNIAEGNGKQSLKDKKPILRDRTRFRIGMRRDSRCTSGLRCDR